MSKSNSTNYKLTGKELIESAFEIVGIDSAGEPLEAEEEQSALRVLNTMLKALQRKLNIWKRKTLTINLVSGQTVYTIGQKSAGTITSFTTLQLNDGSADFVKDDVQVGDTVYNTTDNTSEAVLTVSTANQLTFASELFSVALEDYEITSADISAPRPLKILECNRKDTTGNEVPVTPMTRNEYEALSNKTTAGAPLNYHYDPTLDNGTFYIWQSPNATIVSTWTLELVYQSPIEDIDNVNDSVDVPAENLEALVINLGYRLSNHGFGGIGATDKRTLRQDAKDALDDASGYDQESGSVYCVPELREG